MSGPKYPPQQVDLPQPVKDAARNLVHRFVHLPLGHEREHRTRVFRDTVMAHLELEAGLLMIEAGEERAIALLTHVALTGQLPEVASRHELFGVLRSIGAATLYAESSGELPWGTQHMIGAFLGGMFAMGVFVFSYVF